MIIESFTLLGYHQICGFHLPRALGTTISAPIQVNLGTVVFWPSSNHFEDSVGIAFSPNAKAHFLQWDTTRGSRGERTEEGWTRFSTNNLFDTTLMLEYSLLNHEIWLTQANYIFSCLHMTSNFEDCVLLRDVYFQVKISQTTEESPTGFLFLCPEENFQIGPSSFCWPDFPAYWSLDPFGVERLSVEEATEFGFPALEFITGIGGDRWDNSVYAGVRDFQRAKGFDPESQGVARHLGYPLYYRFNEMDAPFAHVDEEEDYYSGEDNEDQTVAEGDQMDLSW
ncbi:hypothetical protein B0H19DRAFT_709238 [Mycena capillaripes]|nr:hypothetical protein B0H19DRAFT_709238 [Mycena capillaripes]